MLMVGIVSSSGYGGLMTGICCAVVLDIVESFDCKVLLLSNRIGPRLGESLLSFLDDVLGGSIGPMPKSRLP